MTPSEICRAAQEIAPRIQLRDIWFILRQMERRGLVTCFNPMELTGKVYFWRAARTPDIHAVNWQGYACVVRARVRRLVLLNLARIGDESASRIRRTLIERRSVGLNSVIRALRDLRSLKLVAIVGEGYKRGQKLYRLTARGQRIAELLALRTDSPQRLLNPAPTSTHVQKAKEENSPATRGRNSRRAA